MNLSQCEGVEAVEMLGELINGDAWLISVAIATGRIEMVCDFSSLEAGNIDDQSSSEITLHFGDVSHLNFHYEQNVFGSNENDISTIDVAKISKQREEDTRAKWHINLEFTYGKLDFVFGLLNISHKRLADEPTV